MEKKFYENHSIINDRELPFIFHYDTVSSGFISHNWHSNIELLYITNGSGEVHCSSVTYPVQKGDIFIVNSNALHSVISASSINYYCLICDADFCLNNGLDTENINYINIVKSKTAESLFCNVVNEFSRTDDNFRSASIKSTILQLLVYLSVNYSEKKGKTAKPVSTTDENIKLAIGYLKSHFNEQLTIDEIAKKANLSKYYFIRQFKAATGLSPIAFLNSIRCENAKKLLAKNKYSIHEIAIQCGFENDSYFSKTFKKYTNMLPKEFQKSNIMLLNSNINN